MTLRQLISALTYFAEVEEFDIDEEVVVNLCDKNGATSQNSLSSTPIGIGKISLIRKNAKKS